MGETFCLPLRLLTRHCFDRLEYPLIFLRHPFLSMLYSFVSILYLFEEFHNEDLLTFHTRSDSQKKLCTYLETGTADVASILERRAYLTSFNLKLLPDFTSRKNPHTPPHFSHSLAHFIHSSDSDEDFSYDHSSATKAFQS